MAIQNDPDIGKLLEERQKQVFFDYYSNMTRPLFNMFDGQSIIPKDIRCNKCEGFGYVHLGADGNCDECGGKGVPPIPNCEIFNDSNLSKAKND